MKHEPGLYLAPKVKFWGEGKQFKLFVETVPGFPYFLFIGCHGDVSVSIYRIKHIKMSLYHQ